MTDYTWQSETYSKTYWGVADITPEQQGDHIVRYLSWCSIQCLYTHSIHWEQRCTRKRQNSLKSLVHKLKTNLFKKVEVKAKVQVQTVQKSSKGKNSAKVQRQRQRGTLGNELRRGTWETQEEGQVNRSRWDQSGWGNKKKDQTYPKSNPDRFGHTKKKKSHILFQPVQHGKGRPDIVFTYLRSLYSHGYTRPTPPPYFWSIFLMN